MTIDREPHKITMIAKETPAMTELQTELTENGFTCLVSPYREGVLEQVSSRSADVVLVELNGYVPHYTIRNLVQEIKEEGSTPVLALVAAGMLDGIDRNLDVDDFITGPYDVRELVLRIKRLLRKAETTEDSEMIESEGLLIDLARCEVIVEGKKVGLTFKEYELLKFLAGNPGRVHTREALLDKVWGFDYYGGDRTVDVHIRRLRIKIASSGHDFIETVRNIGYRFRAQS